jgi:hypothetical protein
MMCLESCFETIFIAHWNLVKTRAKIHAREPACPPQLIQKLIYNEDRVLTLHCDGTEMPAVDTKFVGPVLFDQQYR